jgi:hypothetical protein
MDPTFIMFIIPLEMFTDSLSYIIKYLKSNIFHNSLEMFNLLLIAQGMLGFLVDNIYVVFGDQDFQQSVGIPKGTNCAPLLQTYSCIHMRQNLFRNCYGIITKN